MDWREGGELGGFLTYLSPRVSERLSAADGPGDPAPENVESGRRTVLQQLAAPVPTLACSGARPARDGSFQTVPLAAADMNYFKTWRWVYGFEMAARTDADIAARCGTMRGFAFVTSLATPWGAGLQVGTGTGARPATIGDVFRSERNVAMVVRWHIRFPAHIVSGGHSGAVIRAVLSAAGVGTNPDTWGDAEENRLTNAIVASPDVPDTMGTVENWPTWTAASNPYRYTLDLSTLPAAERTLAPTAGHFV